MRKLEVRGAGLHRAVVRLCGSSQPVALNQALGHWPTNQAADDETKGGAGNAQSQRALHAMLLFQHIGPGASRAVSADERDGASNQTDQWIKPQQTGQRDADGVLHHDEDHDDQQKDNQRTAAFSQLGKVGTQTDGGEKHQHEHGLQAAIKAEAIAGAQIKGIRQQSGHQTARHGFRNIEVAQKANVLDHDLAHQQDQHSENQGVVSTELNIHKQSKAMPRCATQARLEKKSLKIKMASILPTQGAEAGGQSLRYTQAKAGDHARYEVTRNNGA